MFDRPGDSYYEHMRRAQDANRALSDLENKLNSFLVDDRKPKPAESTCRFPDQMRRMSAGMIYSGGSLKNSDALAAKSKDSEEATTARRSSELFSVHPPHISRKPSFFSIAESMIQPQKGVSQGDAHVFTLSSHSSVPTRSDEMLVNIAKESEDVKRENKQLRKRVEDLLCTIDELSNDYKQYRKAEPKGEDTRSSVAVKYEKQKQKMKVLKENIARLTEENRSLKENLVDMQRQFMEAISKVAVGKQTNVKIEPQDENEYYGERTKRDYSKGSLHSHPVTYQELVVYLRNERQKAFGSGQESEVDVSSRRRSSMISNEVPNHQKPVNRTLLTSRRQSDTENFDKPNPPSTSRTRTTSRPALQPLRQWK